MKAMVIYRTKMNKRWQKVADEEEGGKERGKKGTSAHDCNNC